MKGGAAKSCYGREILGDVGRGLSVHVVQLRRWLRHGAAIPRCEVPEIVMRVGTVHVVYQHFEVRCRVDFERCRGLRLRHQRHLRGLAVDVVQFRSYHLLRGVQNPGAVGLLELPDLGGLGRSASFGKKYNLRQNVRRECVILFLFLFCCV